MRIRALTALAGVVAAGIVVLPAAPAAALTGVERVMTVSASDSQDKYLTAYCPRGKAAVGGGARISGGGEPYVHLTVLAPAGETGFAAHAEEYRTGTQLTWELTVWAVCAVPPPNLTYRSDVTPLAPGDAKAVEPRCPDGTSVIGMGANIVGGRGRVLLRDMYPRDSRRVLVQAVEDRDGYDDAWMLGGYAICATVGAYLKVRVSGYDSQNPKGAGVDCREGDWPLNSVGFNVFGPPGVLGVNDVMVGHPVSAGATAYEMPFGQQGVSLWYVGAYGICVE